MTTESPILETITEIIEELEKIQEDELSAPIDLLLDRNARELGAAPEAHPAMELPAAVQRRRFRFL